MQLNIMGKWSRYITIKREGRGTIKKHPDFERYYPRVSVSGDIYSAVVLSLEEAEAFISKCMIRNYHSKSGSGGDSL